ncbi:MAG: hypothetical protein ABWZ82_03170 [Candidatus Limnocylindrales bacterium]
MPDTDPLSAGISNTGLTTRLHVADPRATAVVLLPGDPSRTIGSFDISIAPPVDADDPRTEVRIRIHGADAHVAPVRLRVGESADPIWATVIEVLGGDAGVVAHRIGRLELTRDEIRVPRWRLPVAGADAVALDGAWWSLVSTRIAAEASTTGSAASEPLDRLRARLMRQPVSSMRRLIDASVGDVTGDGIPEIAISFRRPYERTLLNASLPRRSWTDAAGLTAHVGLYQDTDLSEVWVAGTLVRPVRRLAACTEAIAVAYSTLRRARIVATSAWRWQGFAFLPLPELPGPGRPTCIDIDRDGRPEAAIVERSPA